MHEAVGLIMVLGIMEYTVYADEGIFLFLLPLCCFPGPFHSGLSFFIRKLHIYHHMQKILQTLGLFLCKYWHGIARANAIQFGMEHAAPGIIFLSAHCIHPLVLYTEECT